MHAVNSQSAEVCRQPVLYKYNDLFHHAARRCVSYLKKKSLPVDPELSGLFFPRAKV